MCAVLRYEGALVGQVHESIFFRDVDSFRQHYSSTSFLSLVPLQTVSGCVQCCSQQKIFQTTSILLTFLFHLFLFLFLFLFLLQTNFSLQ